MSLALAIIAPSELNAQQLTGILSPPSVAMHIFVPTSHSFMVESWLHESTTLP